MNAFLSRRIAETQRLRKPAQQLAELKSEGDKFQKRKTELSDACKKLQSDLDRYQQVRFAAATPLGVAAGRAGPAVAGRNGHPQDRRRPRRHRAARTVPGPAVARRPGRRPGRTILAEALGPQGWQVQLPSKHSQETLAAGGPWEFEIRIEDPEAKEPEPVDPRRGRRRAGPRRESHDAQRSRKTAPAGGADGDHPGRIRLVVQPVQRAKLQAITGAYQAAVDEFDKIGPYDAANAARRNRNLTDEVRRRAKRKQELESRADAVLGHAVDPQRRIQAGGQLTELFSGHGLQVLHEEPAVKGDETKLPRSLAGAIDRLDKDRGRKTQETAQVRRLQLLGRYVDLMEAVEELAQADNPPGVPIRLTMAEADADAEGTVVDPLGLDANGRGRESRTRKRKRRKRKAGRRKEKPDAEGKKLPAGGRRRNGKTKSVAVRETHHALPVVGAFHAPYKEPKTLRTETDGYDDGR